jgi:hypothetical protein
MEHILSDLRSCQEAGGFPVTLKHKGAIHHLNFKFPIALVVGDCEGPDKLCGRYGSHSVNVQLVCRDCDCPSAQSDNPSYVCRPLLQHTLHVAAQNNTSSIYSHHDIQNAFHSLCFGGDVQGIHGCTPPETLHLYQQGLYKYALIHLFSAVLNSRQCSELDDLIGCLSSSFQRQSDRSMPRFSFPHGVTNLSRITAEEVTGVVLLCTVAIRTQSFLRKVCTTWNGRSYTTHRELFDKCLEFAKLFEAMLSLESWMESDHHSREFVAHRSRPIIRCVMHKYKSTVERKDGNGLKLPKFHQLLHVPRYILKFGSPKNFNSGRCESHHIKLSKMPASTAQRRVATFEHQVGSRITDHLVVNRALFNLESNDRRVQSLPAVLGGTSFYLCCMMEGDSYVAMRNHHNTAQLEYPADLLNSVGRLLSPLFADHLVPCFTEHRRGNSRELIFRGHPNYRGRPWHDWAFFKWQSDNGTVSEYPGKIYFFCDLRNIVVNEDLPCQFPPGIYAVIHSMHNVPTLVFQSRLLRKGSLSANSSFEICDVDTLSKPAFVVNNDGQVNSFFIIPDRKSWSSILFSGDASH